MCICKPVSAVLGPELRIFEAMISSSKQQYDRDNQHNESLIWFTFRAKTNRALSHFSRDGQFGTRMHFRRHSPGAAPRATAGTRPDTHSIPWPSRTPPSQNLRCPSGRVNSISLIRCRSGCYCRKNHPPWRGESGRPPRIYSCHLVWAWGNDPSKRRSRSWDIELPWSGCRRD